MAQLVVCVALHGLFFFVMENYKGLFPEVTLPHKQCLSPLRSRPAAYHCTYYMREKSHKKHLKSPTQRVGFHLGAVRDRGKSINILDN